MSAGADEGACIEAVTKFVRLSWSLGPPSPHSPALPPACSFPKLIGIINSSRKPYIDFPLRKLVQIHATKVKSSSPLLSATKKPVQQPARLRTPPSVHSHPALPQQLMTASTTLYHPTLTPTNSPYNRAHPNPLVSPLPTPCHANIPNPKSCLQTTTPRRRSLRARCLNTPYPAETPQHNALPLKSYHTTTTHN